MGLNDGNETMSVKEMMAALERLEKLWAQENEEEETATAQDAIREGGLDFLNVLESTQTQAFAAAGTVEARGGGKKGYIYAAVEVPANTIEQLEKTLATPEAAGNEFTIHVEMMRVAYAVLQLKQDLGLTESRTGMLRGERREP